MAMNYENKIIQGDSLEVLPKIPRKTVDLIVTDPPYSILDGVTKVGNNIVTNKTAWGDWDMSKSEGLILIAGILKECDRLLKDSGSSIVFYDRSDITRIKDIGEELGWDPMNTYAIVKSNPLPSFNKKSFRSGFELAIIFNKDKGERKINFIGQSNMINYYTYTIGNKQTDHPTEKPLEPIERFVKMFTDEDDLVLDPFLGSGTTAVAAKRNKRRYTGIEIKPEYVKMAKERLKSVKSSKNITDMIKG